MTLVVLAMALGLSGEQAHGDGIGLVLNSKSLPDATVAVIDPESGTSVGGGGSDVNLAVGDIILFRFSFSAVPDKAVMGQMAYLTEYIPQGTELVGARILAPDDTGRLVTVEPFHPGLTRDGCSNALCNYGLAQPLDCGNSTCVLQDGSISQLIADTGIFYSTDDRTLHNPNGEFLSTNNGIEMTPQPAGVSITSKLIGDNIGPFYVHNVWDFLQQQVFGIAAGNTPHRYGSPVAGPDTYYGKEITENAGNGDLEFLDNDGPWKRIFYPGSLTGTGNGNDDGEFGELGRAVAPSAAGWDLSPFNPGGGGPSGTIRSDSDGRLNAVRFAMGQARLGVPMFAEVALRVTEVPFHPTFNDPLLASGGNVDCAEVFGSDISGNYPTDNKGLDNPWLVSMGSPTCVFLRNKFDLNVDQPLWFQSGRLTYTLEGSNLSVNLETGAQACLKYAGGLAFDAASASPTPTSTVCTAAACGDTSTFSNCLIYDLGDLAPSDDYTIAAEFLPTGTADKNPRIVQAVYSSDQMTIDVGTLAGGFTTQALSYVTALGIPEVTLAGDWFPATTGNAVQGQIHTISGTLDNEGSGPFGPEHIFVHLPAGWRLTSTGGGAEEDVQLNADILDCIDGCGTENPVLAVNGGHPLVAAGGSQTFSFDVIIPSDANGDTGLYNIDIGVNQTTGGFGISSQAYFHKAIVVNVNQPRTEKPILDCPIGSADQTIEGSTTGGTGTDILVYFNLVERAAGDSLAAGNWSIGVADTDGWNSVGGGYSQFGDVYGGLEIRATAADTANNLLESELSEPCEVTFVPQCADGLGNDSDGPGGVDDGFIDFPNDPGCSSPFDNSETDPVSPECSDGIDNASDSDGLADWAGIWVGGVMTVPPDPECSGPDDDSEGGDTACEDGTDNDSDGLIDADDPGCLDSFGVYDPNDATEIERPACSDGIDNDGDGQIDFGGLDADNNGTIDVPGDPDCVSAFDEDEGFRPTSNDIKARLLVVMDTSGSMNLNTCTGTVPGSGDFQEFTGGDGSTECPGLDVATATCDTDTDGNGLPDDSRMAKVKEGMSNVIAGFGEVEFGLMRFFQRDEEFICPTNFGTQRSGGWQGGGEICSAPNIFNEGELLVGFSNENQNELLLWMDGDSNYPSIDPELVPAGLDHELRGSGTTPIAGSLDSALQTLQTVQGGDLVGACRPYAVVLVTDGDETCGGTPTTEAAALAAAGIDVYVIGFATTDPTTNANLDAIAAAGNTGSAIIVDDAATLSQAMATIVSETLLVEECNGLDDDCDCLDDPATPGILENDLDGDGIECEPGDVGVDEDFLDELFCDQDNGQPNAVLCVDPGDDCDDTDDNCQNGIDDEVVNACGFCGPLPVDNCDDFDNDCDGLVDEIGGVPGAACAGCTPTGPEVCNGIDDDCMGGIDDNLGDLGQCVGLCNTVPRQCVSGELECTGLIDPTQEDTLDTCDGANNDCDSLTDEASVVCYDPNNDGLANDIGCDVGTGACVGLCRLGVQGCLLPADPGYPGASANCVGDNGPFTDFCDGLDNDCDGSIDEDFPVGDVCFNANGLPGVCMVPGQIICDPNDNNATICTAPDITPGDEVCGNGDEDCDGFVDENLPADPLPAPIGNTCGGTGTSCNAGVIACVNGIPTCEGVVGGTQELCDGADNDCDNLTDEDTQAEPLPGVGVECYDPNDDEVLDDIGCTGAGTAQAACVGTCNFGATICVNGGFECSGDIGPAVSETCNGLDDNCDGLVDNEATCPAAGDVCFEGECVSPCADAEFPCPLDFFCQTVPDEGMFCTSDPCINIQCEADEQCDKVSGSCFDPCDTTTCLAGQTCLLGECNDCFDFGFGCAVDQNCLIGNTPGVGECVTDPCFFTECQDDQFCRDGGCVDVTCDPACPTGQVCDEGACIADLCNGVECGTRICNPMSGECVADVCGNKFCPQGTACDPGTGDCINDPCLALTCPDPLICEIGFDGTGQCVSVIEPELEGDFVAPGGGGGCGGCRVDGSQPLSGWSGLILLGIAVLGFRRRRKKLRPQESSSR